MVYDWRGHSVWTSRTPDERMALMALLERDRDDHESGLNVLHANWNRARQRGWDTDRVLNYKDDNKGYGWFQPLYEPAQLQRAQKLLQHPDFAKYVAEAQMLREGRAKDRVAGATHYLSHPSTMVALEAREPQKYKSWRGWTGYDPATQQYRNQTIQDRSHSFLAPDGLAPGAPSGPAQDGAKQAQIAALLANDVDVGPADYEAANGTMPPKGSPMFGTPSPAPLPPVSSQVDPRLMAQTAAREQQIKMLMGMVNPNVQHPLQAIANAVTMGVTGHMMRDVEKTKGGKTEALIDLMARGKDGNVDPLMAGAIAQGNVPWQQAFAQRQQQAEKEKLIAAVTSRITDDKDLTAQQRQQMIASLPTLDREALEQANKNYVNKVFDPKDSAAKQKIARLAENYVKMGMPKEQAEQWAQTVADGQIKMSQDGTKIINLATMQAFDTTTGRMTQMPMGPQAGQQPGTPGTTPAAPGAPVVGAAPADPGALALTKERINEEQKGVLQMSERVRRLDAIHASINDEALMLKGQAKYKADQWSDWLFGKEIFGSAKAQEGFRVGVEQFFNAYRKEITGAAAAMAELESLKKATINMQLGPSQFRERLNAIRQQAIEELKAKHSHITDGIQNPGTTAVAPPAPAPTGPPPATPGAPQPAAPAGKPPAPMPTDRKQLQKGSPYTLPNGRTGIWDGSGFDIVE